MNITEGMMYRPLSKSLFPHHYLTKNTLILVDLSQNVTVMFLESSTVSLDEF